MAISEPPCLEIRQNGEWLVGYCKTNGLQDIQRHSLSNLCLFLAFYEGAVMEDCRYPCLRRVARPPRILEVEIRYGQVRPRGLRQSSRTGACIRVTDWGGIVWTCGRLVMRVVGSTEKIMKRKAWALFVAVFFCLSAQRAVACPCCNIHNLLGGSVHGSTDIYRGEVIRPIDRHRAEVRVIKVLRGTHEVGSTVTSNVFRAETGEQFVFCEADARAVEFGILPIAIEDEVLFLLQEKQDVLSMEEAVKRVQGVSIETQAKGMEYIAEHHTAALKPLIAELNSLMPEVFPNNDVFFGEHRLGKLVEALLLKPTDEGRDFVFSQIDAFPSQQSSPFGWHTCILFSLGAIGVSFLLAGLLWLVTCMLLRRPLIFIMALSIFFGCAVWYSYHLFVSPSIWLDCVAVVTGVLVFVTGLLWLGTGLFLRRPFPHSLRSLLIVVMGTSTCLVYAAWYSYPVPHNPSSRGVFLRDMLSSARRHQELSSAVKEYVIDMCSTQEGFDLAEAVYAVVLAEVATPDELQTKLTNRESADMLALGLFYAANYESRWWQHEKAWTLFHKAFSLAQTRRLKAAISKQLQSSEQFQRRKPNDSDKTPGRSRQSGGHRMEGLLATAQ